jgi:hypothetical protein
LAIPRTSVIAAAFEAAVLRKPAPGRQNIMVGKIDHPNHKGNNRMLDQATINEFAKAMAGVQVALPWYVYAAIAGISLVTSCLGAYWGAFWKTRGIQRATTAGFNVLKTQLGKV